MEYHREHDCCCIWFSSKTGVKILTVGLLSAVLIELPSFHFVRALLKVGILSAFCLMHYEDDEKARALCLLTYFLGTPAIATINFIMYRNILLDSVMFAKELCWLLRSSSA